MALGAEMDRLLGHLIDRIQHGDYMSRMAAAKTLGRMGDAQAVPYLIRALLDDDDWVSAAAAEALGSIGDAQAVPALLEALCSESRVNQFNELARNHPSWGMVQDWEDIRNVRIAAAHALGQIGDSSAVPGLLEALKDENDHWVRSVAAYNLRSFVDDRVIYGLVEALEDEYTVVRKTAIESLAEIGPKVADEHILTYMISGLAERLLDRAPVSFSCDSDRVGRYAATALQRIGTQAALETLDEWQRSTAEINS
jgi:HEAT repeat protein